MTDDNSSTFMALWKEHRESTGHSGGCLHICWGCDDRVICVDCEEFTRGPGRWAKALEKETGCRCYFGGGPYGSDVEYVVTEPEKETE